MLASGTGSLIDIVGGVVSGGVTIIGNGIVDIETAGSRENVTFLSNGSGGLEIIDTQANSSAYAGKVSGFGGVHGSNSVQFIDLVSVTFVSGQMSETYSATTLGSGLLTVTSGGTIVAQINLLGTGYTTSGFHLSSAADGSTIITDPAVVSGGSGGVVSGLTLGPSSRPDEGEDEPMSKVGIDGSKGLSQGDAHLPSSVPNSAADPPDAANGGRAQADSHLPTQLPNLSDLLAPDSSFEPNDNALRPERLGYIAHPSRAHVVASVWQSPGRYRHVLARTDPEKQRLAPRPTYCILRS